MIRPSYNHKHYASARDRFFRPASINFFEREFPSLFGPVMREKLADELTGLFEDLNPQTQRLKPGQILWNALDKHTRGDSDNRRYVPVVLSLVSEEDVKDLVNNQPRQVVTQNMVARIVREAYEQGGILSMRDVGLLLLRLPSEASQLRIAYEKRNDCLLPHTGRLHDMGTCISHKDTIIYKVIIQKRIRPTWLVNAITLKAQSIATCMTITGSKPFIRRARTLTTSTSLPASVGT